MLYWPCALQLLADGAATTSTIKEAFTAGASPPVAEWPCARQLLAEGAATNCELEGLADAVLALRSSAAD